MKSTGIVRKIDRLGRVVIPKEIRKTLRIHVGDPLEIFTDRDGQIIFKKYSPIAELSSLVNEYCEVLRDALGCCIVICDKDMILAVSGVPHQEYVENYTSKKLAYHITKGQQLKLTGADMIEVIEREDMSRYLAQVVHPIMVDHDAIGAIVALNPTRDFLESDFQVLKAIVRLMEKHMDY